MPIVIFFYVGFKIVKRTKWKRLAEIDVTSGRREMDLPAILAEVSLLSSFFLVPLSSWLGWDELGGSWEELNWILEGVLIDLKTGTCYSGYMAMVQEVVEHRLLNRDRLSSVVYPTVGSRHLSIAKSRLKAASSHCDQRKQSSRDELWLCIYGNSVTVHLLTV